MGKDKETKGLPELAEGRFWRIKEVVNRELRVSLMYRLSRWRVRELDWGTTSLMGDIPEEACRVLRHRLAWERERAHVESVVGDYPPKVLK